MKILLATSEAVPFAKTGGLADVCGALPAALADLGHEPVVIMPAYRQTRQAGVPIEPTGVRFQVPIGNKSVTGSFLKSHLPSTKVPVYLVQQDQYYDRPQLYQESGRDYKDNCERFVFFCRAVLEAIKLLDLRVDMLHANDWQTGLVPAYLKIEHRGVPGYEQIGTLFTIHNMAYQGLFWHWDMLLTGVDWKYFNWHQMEFFGSLNLLKTGLVFADRVNTVSPRYAEEIQIPPLGCGLEGVLQNRRDMLSGIVNGVDYQQWDPAIDVNLPVTYDRQTVEAGKQAAKAALAAELGLPLGPRTPLVAFIGRLVEQKGIDLLVATMRDWVQSRDVAWVVLGSGEGTYPAQLKMLAERYPHKVAVRLEFSDRLAHLIEAGGDILLMPSRYEPCGLSQLYSFKYGTVPVARATGGLVDTITDANDKTLAAGTATGFLFSEYSGLALAEALERATNTFAQPQIWRRIVETGMKQDWSWTASARQYVDLYRATLAKFQQPLTANGA
ncbi:MAG TPA: glycogen synthase GlgA [Pirellulales bacterium]|nr:glycogen synthase GlgA [Pirellulales bacterium]